MDCAVIYSEKALSDLHEITAFIAADNVQVAASFANRLVDLAESLALAGTRSSCEAMEKCARHHVGAVSDFLSLRSSGQPGGGATFLAWSTGSKHIGNLETGVTFAVNIFPTDRN